MKGVEIFEQELSNRNGRVGKMAILRGGLNTDNPTATMNDAVQEYVGRKGHNQFIEIHLDNPWVRVIVIGINELEYKEFLGQKAYE